MPTRARPSKERLRELARRPQENPVWYIERAFGTTLWEKQREIVRSVWKNRYTSVASCHASGKTFTAGQITIAFLQAFPHSIVLSTAPTYRQVEDALWKEINSAYLRARNIWDVPGKMLGTRYELAPDWYAVGFATDDPNRFQAYHAPMILIIIDESSGVAAPIFDAIEGIGSTGNVRILQLANPTDPSGQFAQTFKSPFYTNFRISCLDTPNFAPFVVRDASGQVDEDASLDRLAASTEKEREQALVAPYLIAPEWVYQRMQAWGLGSPQFAARCLGKFPAEGEDTLISLQKALDAKWTERGGKAECRNAIYGTEEVLGVDVARLGSDQTVFAHRVGNRVLPLERWSKQDTMATVGKIVRWKIRHPFGKIHVDEPGVGGGVIDRLRELDVDGVASINVGEAAYRKEDFINKRAEFYWGLRVRFQEGDIAIPDDDQLVDELTSLKVDYQSNGKIKIEEKKDMRRRGLKSPDSADAVMLAFAPTHVGAFGSDAPEEDPDASVPQSITSGLLDRVY